MVSGHSTGTVSALGMLWSEWWLGDGTARGRAGVITVQLGHRVGSASAPGVPSAASRLVVKGGGSHHSATR